MQEKKELKVGDWVRVKRNLAVHEIGDVAHAGLWLARLMFHNSSSRTGP